MIRITAISDTHGRHYELDLPGGDILIHAGDVSSRGYVNEITGFLKWFKAQSRKYSTCVFIAGNHDWLFKTEPTSAMSLIDSCKLVDYLQDDLLCVGNDYEHMIKIYGSPWQPEFGGWAFNLPRDGDELLSKWALIPENTDILVTHGPPIGILDKSGPPYSLSDLGCSLLRDRVNVVKPKIHIFGHIHGSSGYYFDGDTHFINASVLDERYYNNYKPFTFDWDEISNNLIIV